MQGRDLKPKPKKKKVETEDLVARVDTRLGNNDDGNARNELLKAYQQVLCCRVSVVLKRTV